MSEYILLEYYFAKCGENDPRCDAILDRLDYVTRMLYTFIDGDTEDDFTIYHVGHFINKVTTLVTQINIGTRNQ